MVLDDFLAVLFNDLDAEEVGRGEFLNLGVGLGIQVEFDWIAELTALDVWHEGSSVVSGAFDGASSAWGGTVEFSDDHGLHALQATLIVGTDWGDQDYKGILGGWSDADLDAVTNYQWSQIKRTTRGVWWDVVLVVLDDSVDGLHEDLLSWGIHAKSLARVLQTLGVLLWSENADGLVFGSEGLETLEDSLTVVQAAASDVHWDVWVVHKSALVPHAVLGLVHDEGASFGCT